MDYFIKEANIYFILKIITIIGALQIGLFIFGKKYNIIEMISYNEYIEKSLYIIILISKVFMIIAFIMIHLQLQENKKRNSIVNKVS